MIKLLRWITYTTVIIATFFAGIYFNQLLLIPSQPTNFADTISAIVALVGLTVATITITNWKKSKIQEDSYQLIKNYVAELVLIETTVTEILIENTSICPLPGSIPPSKSFVVETFQNIDTLQKTLNKLHFKIYQTKDELPFWGSKLTPTHEENHKTLMTELDNFQVVANCLRSNLATYHSNGFNNIDFVIKEHEKLVNRFQKIKSTLTDRKTSKMSDMFSIEN